MGLLQWQDSYSVGVPKFDVQHKHLFSLLNELNDAMAQGKGNDVLGKTLRELISYTKGHFLAEEQLMQIRRYPGFPTHKAEHDKLTQKVLKFQEEFCEGKIGLSVAIMSFLREWLLDHIAGTDKQYGPYLS